MAPLTSWEQLEPTVPHVVATMRRYPEQIDCVLRARQPVVAPGVTHVRRVPIMPPETIRTLPFGTALVLLRSAPPLVTELRKWTDRKDADVLRGQRAAVESALRCPVAGGAEPP